jgi:hypothetical protein
MTATTTASGHFEIDIRNRNAYNAQVAAQQNYASWGFTDSSVFTAAVDTSIDQNVTITATLANSADTMTLESYTVEVLPGQ